MINISNRHRAFLVGIFILAAYSMLTYTITQNVFWGIGTDILSGLAVIGIPILLFPFFNSKQNKKINYAYLISRFIEGILMIVGGVVLLSPTLVSYRDFIYSDIHIYFFISGALFFYILLHRTSIVPRFISVWGIWATIILFVITMMDVFKLDYPLLKGLVVLMILNELFLAIWLMVKGFDLSDTD